MEKPSRTIRVFVSSTFRDMHAERDHLNRFVFPELRNRCLSRGADFIGIDLRWGVTSEEAGLTGSGSLRISLEEIERCRPFFVCLLGDRYGYVPPPEEIPSDLFEAVTSDPILPAGSLSTLRKCYVLDPTCDPPVYRLRSLIDKTGSGFEKLAEFFERLATFWEQRGLQDAGHSITAREILRGVFEEGFPRTHALFYLRKSGIHESPYFPESFLPVFVEQTPRGSQRLKDLKRRINAERHEVVVREYSVRYAGLTIDPHFLPDGLTDTDRGALADGVIRPHEVAISSPALRLALDNHGTVALDDMEALGTMLLEDLWKAIEVELDRPPEIQDPLEHERRGHDLFIRTRARNLRGRDDLLEKMPAYVSDASDLRPLVLTGAPGSGKSAVMAAFVEQCRQHHPETLVIPCFIGAVPGSTILTNTLSYLCRTLQAECNVEEEIPDDPRQLRHKLPIFLEKAAERHRVILVIDAVNQLDPADRAHELDWFPFCLKPGSKVLVSTLEGECLARLKARVPREHLLEVPPLAEDHRRAIVEDFLGERRKRLTKDQMAVLLDTDKRPEAALPLYLLVALDELTLFSSYENLTERIEGLPPTIPELFGQVLERLELDHGRDLTEALLRWIVASRFGLMETEVRDLLGRRFPYLAVVQWTRLYRGLQFYLRPSDEGSGETESLIDFYHDQLRFAVSRRYFGMETPESDAKKPYLETQAQLAEYFLSIAFRGDPGRWRERPIPRPQ